MKRRRMVLGLLICCLVLFLGACGKQEATDDTAEKSSVEQIKERGKLIIATASGYAPYEFFDLNGDPKKVVGLDIAFAQALADELGVDLEVKDMTFSSILGSVTQGQVDMAVAGMTATDERRKSVDFSDPYTDNTNRIVVLKENADKYQTLDDLKDARIAVQKATAQETIANETIKPKQVISLEKLPDAFLNLTSGQADAIVVEDTVALQYLLSDDRLVYADAEVPEEVRVKSTSIAVPKGDTELLEVINKAIKENKENGNFELWLDEYSEIAQKSAQK